MALRVLLADESSTIKKVFQLALQDYAVEVKPVALGVDVASVAADFKPDILFADVLLQKKNGYDVCAELKADPRLSQIPVILMWSNFMELDQDKYQASGADHALEKPFDVAQLRKVVADFVPKTTSQTLSKYLEFPTLPEIEEPKAPEAEAAAPEEDDFKPVSIPKINTQKEKFQVNIDPMADDEAELTFSKRPNPSVQAPAPQTSRASANEPTREFDVEADDEDFSFHKPGKAPSSVAPRSPSASMNSNSGSSFELSREDVYEIVQRLAPKIIEEIAWKVIPDLATQIIEREIKNLLAEKDKQISP